MKSERFRDALDTWTEVPGKRSRSEAAAILPICDDCEHQRRDKCLRSCCVGKPIFRWLRNPAKHCPEGFW